MTRQARVTRAALFWDSSNSTLLLSETPTAIGHVSDTKGRALSIREHGCKEVFSAGQS